MVVDGEVEKASELPSQVHPRLCREKSVEQFFQRSGKQRFLSLFGHRAHTQRRQSKFLPLAGRKKILVELHSSKKKLEVLLFAAEGVSVRRGIQRWQKSWHVEISLARQTERTDATPADCFFFSFGFVFRLERMISRDEARRQAGKHASVEDLCKMLSTFRKGLERDARHQLPDLHSQPESMVGELYMRPTIEPLKPHLLRSLRVVSASKEGRHLICQTVRVSSGS